MDKSLLRDYYVEFHERRHKYSGTVSSQIIDLIKEIIGKGKKILDLGCRDGSLTKNYVKDNEVVGVDIDDVALSICNKNLGIQTFHLDINEPLPFDNSSFDIVMAGDIIEHVIFPEMLLKEVQRVLKSKGVFCGSTPNVTRIKNRFQFLFGNTPFFDDTAHLRYFSYPSLEEFLNKHFYKDVIIPFGGHIIGNKKHGFLKLGIEITPTTPLWLGILFSSNFFWKAIKA